MYTVEVLRLPSSLTTYMTGVDINRDIEDVCVRGAVCVYVCTACVHNEASVLHLRLTLYVMYNAR